MQRIEASERRNRVVDAIELAGLSEDLLERYPTELSAGQQQRAGIARAMITRPALVVLDEPTSALDPTARAEIIELLMQIQSERGTAYLFISHDLSTVRFIPEAWRVRKLAELPIWRAGTVGEIAPIAVLLASDEGSYFIGATLNPNGGDYMI